MKAGAIAAWALQALPGRSAPEDLAWLRPHCCPPARTMLPSSRHALPDLQPRVGCGPGHSQACCSTVYDASTTLRQPTGKHWLSVWCCHVLRTFTRGADPQDAPDDLHALDLYVERVLPQCRDVSVRHMDLARLLSPEDGCVTHFPINCFCHQCLRLRRQAQGVPTPPCGCYCIAEQLVVQGCSYRDLLE